MQRPIALPSHTAFSLEICFPTTLVVLEVRQTDLSTPRELASWPLRPAFPQKGISHVTTQRILVHEIDYSTFLETVLIREAAMGGAFRHYKIAITMRADAELVCFAIWVCGSAAVNKLAEIVTAAYEITVD